MSTTVDTGPIALNDVIIAKRVPQIKPHEPPVQPTDTVDLSDAAQKIVGGGLLKPLSPVIAEAPETNQPIVYYADGFHPAPKLPPITEPVADEPTPAGIDLPPVPTTKIPVASAPLPPATTSPAAVAAPVAIDDLLFPRQPLTPTRSSTAPLTPVLSNQPVTLDTGKTPNVKSTSHGKLAGAVTTLQTSGAARLSSISGHFIAPYNTAQFLKLFKT